MGQQSQKQNLADTHDVSMRQQQVSPESSASVDSQNGLQTGIPYLHNEVGNRAVRHFLQIVKEDSGRNQTKLVVGQPKDKYEREADRIAVSATKSLNPALSQSPDRFAFSHERPRSIHAQPIVQRMPAAHSFPEPADLNNTVPEAVARSIERMQGQGETLSDHVRENMEPALGIELGNVRIHSDSRSDQLGRSLGAHAFTLGQDIFFRKGAYDTVSQSGLELLSHELIHVAQQQGSAHPYFIQRSVDQDVRAILNNYELNRIEALYDYFYDIDQHTNSLPEAQNLLDTLSDIAPDPQSLSRLFDDLVEGDPDNRRRLLNALERGIDRLSELAAEDDYYLQGILESTVAVDETGMEISRGPEPEPPDITRGGQSPQEVREATEGELRLSQAIERMQVGRGPYGHGPGITVPPMAQLASPVAYGALSVAAYIDGVLDGVSGSLSPADRQTLRRRFSTSGLSSLALGPIVAAGAAVGIIEDIIDAIRGIAEIIGNIGDFARVLLEIIVQLISSQGPDVARQLGLETGRQYARDEILPFRDYDPVRFAYELGETAGPTIVYAVLSLVTGGAVAGAATVIRILDRLRHFPSIGRLLERITLMVRRIRRRGSDPEQQQEPFRFRIGGGQITMRELLLWERPRTVMVPGSGEATIRGHTLQHHGSFHNQESLRRRLPVPERMPHVRRLWDQQAIASSRWVDDSTMLQTINNIISDNITDIENAIQSGGSWVRRRNPVNQTVGHGWIPRSQRPRLARDHGVRHGWFYTENLRHVTIVIEPDHSGGWYLTSAYPDSPSYTFSS